MNAKPKLSRKAAEPSKVDKPSRYSSSKREQNAKDILAKHAAVLARLAK